MTTIWHAPPQFLTWVGTQVHRHREELLRYARRRGLAAEDALDAVQDTFVTFLGLPDAKRLAELASDDGGDVIRLLTVLLRNHVANRRRKRDRHADGLERLERERAGDLDESSADLIARAEQFARVQGCILLMVRLQRAVIELALIDDESHEAIAARLGITVANARVLLHRARRHVQSCTFAEHGQLAPREENPAASV